MSKAIWLMVLASAALAVMSLQVKTLSSAIGVAETVFLRSFVHLLLLVPVLLKLRIGLARDFKPILLVRGAFGYVGVLCFFYSLRSLPVSISILIAWTSPIFTILVSSVLSREKISPYAGLAIAVTMAGLYIFLAPQHLENTVQPKLLLVALLGAVSAGVSYAVLKKTDPGTSPHSVAFFFSLVALLASTPATLAHAMLPRLQLWLPILILGVGAAIYQYSVARAYLIAPAAKVAPMSLLTPLLGGVLDRVWLGQMLAPHQLWGGGLMLLGIGLIHFRAAWPQRLAHLPGSWTAPARYRHSS